MKEILKIWRFLTPCALGILGAIIGSFIFGKAEFEYWKIIPIIILYVVMNLLENWQYMNGLYKGIHDGIAATIAEPENEVVQSVRAYIERQKKN